jgi:hypothetical protein
MNNMEKTIKDWLMELPDGYRERALANMTKYALEWSDVSLKDALCCAFAWDESQEGSDFWVEVHNHYIWGTPLPPLP